MTYKYITEADEPEKTDAKQVEATVVADINVNGILVQLHEKALSQLGSKEYTIENSAIDGTGKNAKFYGAGDHIVLARCVDASKEIPKPDALKLIQTYVQWFVGPDLKSDLKEEDLIEMGIDGTAKSEEDKKKEKDTQEKAEKTLDKASIQLKTNDVLLERMKNNMSFYSYLFEADDETADSKDDNADKETDSDADEKTNEKDKVESAPAYYIVYKIDIEGQKSHPLARALGKFGKKIAGFFGKALGGMGVSFGNWRSGSQGDVKTLGDLAGGLVKTVADAFKKMDINEFISKYKANFVKKFPQSKNENIEAWDLKTLKKEVGNNITPKDLAKIKKAKYSITTKISKGNKSQKVIDKEVIADMMTTSLKGLFKKLTQSISPDDVIKVTNYDDSYKDKNDNMIKKNKSNTKEKKLQTASVDMAKSSFFDFYNTELLKETDDAIVNKDDTNDKIDNNKDIEPTKSVEEYIALAADELKKLATTESSPSYVDGCFESGFDTSENIIKTLQDAGVKDASAFDELKKHKYSFYIATKNAKSAEKTEESIDPELGMNSSEVKMLNKLFESSLVLEEMSSDEELKKKVIELFNTFYRTLNDKILTTNVKDLQEIKDINGYIAEKSEESGTTEETAGKKADETPTDDNKEDNETKKESIQNCFSMLDMLFENTLTNSVYLDNALFEGKNHKALDDKKWTAFKNLVSGHLKDIRANKNEIIKNSYEDQGQLLSFAKGDEAKKNGYDDFIYALFDDNTPEDAAIEKLQKICHRNNFRNDIVYRFKYDPDKKKDPIEITFIDKDPNEQLDDKELKTIIKEDGKEIEEPEPPKHAGWKFTGWDPKPDEMEESGKTFAKYEKNESEEKPNESITYWACPDLNDLLDKVPGKDSKEKGDEKEKDDASADDKLKRTGDDFYIVPMPGLDYKDDDDEDKKTK